MTASGGVIVKVLPERLDPKTCEAFLREIDPVLQSNRPNLVFDFSQVRSLDRVGIELLLRCMEEATKRNGDLKLAAVSPAVAVILEMTRVDRLFEIFCNCADAVESYHRFSTSAIQPLAQVRLPKL